MCDIKPNCCVCVTLGKTDVCDIKPNCCVCDIKKKLMCVAFSQTVVCV